MAAAAGLQPAFHPLFRMSKTLIIAEKPSVAGDIARALGGLSKDKSGEFFEGEKYVVSSAIGHLVEIIPPAGVEAARGKWKFENLPVIPPNFELQPIEKTEARLKVLARLIKRKDVEALVNACDAGREGELIFRYIARYVGTQKPIQRLWLQSMTPAAIREGFQKLRSDDEMQPLADAATCRSEADWLVGINGTRAMTAFNNKSGGFNLTTVGRVQTPTLAIVVEREERIRKFVPRDYWEVHGTFACEAGSYAGRWFDEKFSKDKNGDAELRAERLWEAAKAEGIRDKCLGKPGVVTEETKPTTQSPPLLYDLTSLQREANGRFGFSATRTLQIAQALYERHKVLTYPRTDSRALPEDYQATVKKTLGEMNGTGYERFAATILDQGWVRPNKRVFNNAKVSDHFAIIPTAEKPKSLRDDEAKIYDMVTKRFLAVFYPAAEFQVTTRITRVEGEPFKTEGKVLQKPGWLEVYGREATAENDDSGANLVPVKPDEKVNTTEIEVKATQTKPPPRFTEATLLSAMEGAGKLIEDEDLRDAMAEKGLGTPATRASIIEGLIYEKYMLRDGKELVPTAKAFSLLVLLRGLGVEALTKPELTGDWEYQLKEMERGRLQRGAFMREIETMTRQMVERAKAYEHDTIPGDFGVLQVPCPKCGGELHERYKTFQCVKCDWSLFKVILGRQFEPAEVEELLGKGTVGPLQGFRSKQGRSFNAMMKLGAGPEFKAEFDFGNGNGDENGKEEAPDFSDKTPLGICPKCQARVFDHGMNFVCEKNAGPDKSCDFRTGKVILQQTIDEAQLKKLLADGKTELLKGFVSKRTGRKFDAFLVWKDGKVGFEFPPREPRKGGKGKGKSAEPQPKLDFTGQEPVGKCPKCGGKVFEGPADYLCERSQADTKRCTFKTGKQILGRDVEREQVKKLLTARKTDLLDKFISKTGRPFSAWLVLDDKGKVTFEFPPRD
jgi:DNA topoisomerase III